MNQRLTWFEKISIFNIAATLILSIVALAISYNAYQISVNTFASSEKVNALIDKQSEYELYTAVGSLVTISSMLKQNELPKPNISNSLKAFTEIKSVLQSQLKNNSLVRKASLASLWSTVLGNVEFNIKFFELGLKPKTILNGTVEMITEIERKCNELYAEYRRVYPVQLPSSE